MLILSLVLDQASSLLANDFRNYYINSQKYSSKLETNLDYIFTEQVNQVKVDLPVLGAWRSLVESKNTLVLAENTKQAAPVALFSSSTARNAHTQAKALVMASQQMTPSPPPPLVAFLYGVVDVSPYHEEKIESLWREVKKRRSLHFFTAKENNRVYEAVKVAYVALYGRKTLRSLENCIDRARGTATVLGELKADPVVVIASFLHEVFDYIPEKDIAICKALLKTRIGTEAVELVEKCYRQPKLMALKATYTLEQSENHIQMLVVTAEDYRVLYVRLAERLHTMRILKSLDIHRSEKVKIAQEAVNVYAPLAHKMGVMKVKGELEDLAFRIIDPSMFAQSKYTQIAAMKAFQDATEQIKDLLLTDPVMIKYNATYRFTHRVKDKYQLYLKMLRKNLRNVSEVRDALGLRVIFEYPKIPGETVESYRDRGNELCYNFVNRLRSMSGWLPAVNGLKDYISETKQNGYQSIHQFIKNIALGTNVEVQVRTKEMHLRAELGNAAHWHYKDCTYRPELVALKTYNIAWRSEQQRVAMSPAELIGMAKRQILAARVLVFLEDKSHVLNLRKGSTALDAAFAIHKEIGLSTSSVRVKGRRASLGRFLQNGDVISVERVAKKYALSRQHWINYVKNPNTLYSLRKYLREHERESTISAGLVQLISGIAFNKISIRNVHGMLPDAQMIHQLIPRKVRISNYADFLLLLGTSTTLEATSLLSKLFDIPENEFQMGNMARCFSWARLQSRSSWKEEADIVEDLIAPTIYRILPSLGVDIKSNWRHSGFSLFRMFTPQKSKIRTRISAADGIQHLLRKKSYSNIIADVQGSNNDDESLADCAGLFREQIKISPLKSPYTLEATSMGSLNLETFRRMYIEQALRLDIERSKGNPMYIL
jgi:GTP pyrophosphokinase